MPFPKTLFGHSHHANKYLSDGTILGWFRVRFDCVSRGNSGSAALATSRADLTMTDEENFSTLASAGVVLGAARSLDAELFVR